MNEESVGNVMAYFNELRAQQESQQPQQSYIRQTNLGYSQSQGNVINAYAGAGVAAQGMSTVGSRPFDAAMSFNQTMPNQQSSLQGTGQMAASGLPQNAEAYPGNQIGSQQPLGAPEQAQNHEQPERPDMDSDDNEVDQRAAAEQRVEDAGDEFNARDSTGI